MPKSASLGYWGLGFCDLGAAAAVAWALVWRSWAEARPADFVCVTGLGLSLWLLQARRAGPRTGLAVLLGSLAGFAVLVKLNSGLVLAGLLVLALIGSEAPGRERWRCAGLGAAAFIAVFVAAWAGAGQSFRNLADFARASASLVAGYGTAMADALSRSSVAWLAAGMVVVAAVAFGAAVWQHAGKQRVVAIVVLAAWGWAEVKEGFVSGDHYQLFFRVMLVAVALAACLRPPRAVFAGALALAACITVAATVAPVLDPLSSMRSFGPNLADIVQPARFAGLRASARQRLLKEELLPASTLSLLRGRSTAIEPWEDLVAWADPGLRWDPEPVVQSYSAFTSYLDHKDAAFLASARAPERVLYRSLRTGFDSRDQFMDPPATTEAIYCHYTQLALASPWQVLERVPDRCGPAVLVGEAVARFGQPVAVPRLPGKMVVASFALSAPLLSRLEAGLLKPPNTYLRAWEGGSQPVIYRFVTGTATDNHVLSVPASLGYSAAFTPPDIDRLEFTGGGWKAGQGSVKVVFRAVSLSR
jgi:hypothetical protein